MTSDQVYSFESELLEPKPRRLKAKARPWRLVGRIAIVPLALLCASLLFFMFNATAAEVVGLPVPGEILGRVAGGATNGCLVVSYQFKGRTYSSALIGSNRLKLRAGDQVAVQVSPLLPGIGFQLTEPVSSVLPGYVLPWCFTLFWCACLNSLVRAAVIRPSVERALVATGDLCVATISSGKREKNPRRNSHGLVVKYRFTPGSATLLARSVVTGKHIVSKADRAGVQRGDRFTVLYDPASPRNSVLYRFASYQVVKQPASEPEPGACED